MKKIFLTLSILLFFIGNAMAQEVLGKWKTIDDETGKARSIVEIYKENGKIYGKVIEILDAKKKEATCTKCEGTDKGKKIEGLVIMKDLEEDGSEYGDGTIMDPTSGKIYNCYIELEDDNKLKVRGYIGFSLIGRTQYWLRSK